MIDVIPSDEFNVKRQSEQALLELLTALAEQHYSFTAVTPATHARIVARKQEASDLRDIFGWSLPFRAGSICADLLALLERSGELEAEGDLLRSRVRVSTLDGTLFLHSAYPTSAQDSVFFGPDTYRYAALIRDELPQLAPVRRIVDMGSGTGAGGLVAAKLMPDARVTLIDVNPAALRFSAVNAAHAGVDVDLVQGSSLGQVEGDIDLVIANPPYIMDDSDRAYRDGGGMHGAQLSYEWTMAAARRLQAGGQMILYTGVAIVGGIDELLDALERDLPALGCSLRYRELDPDIFGEELEKSAYRAVERIAAVGAVVTKK